MAGGIGIIGGYGLRTRTTATRWSDIEEYVHRLANQSLQMDSSGNVDITGVINIGTSGGIYQGTGTFASPTTGLKIYSDGTNGVIELWDASAKAFSLTHTKLLFGSNVAAAATTALAVFAENTTYNSESLGAGDVLLGDNSSNKANLLWDKSAGKLQLRGGTTMQCEIGTDGKLYAGGGNIILDANGLSILGGTGSSNSILWKSGSNTIVSLYGYRSGTTNFLTGGVDIVNANDETNILLTANGSLASYTTGLDIYVNDGVTADSYCRFVVNNTQELKVSPSLVAIAGGLNVGSATGAGTGAIKASSTVSATSGFLAPLSNATAVWGIDAQATGTSVADTATYQPFGNTNAFSGLFLVNALDSGSVGLFMQGGNTVVLVSESVANTFSVTQGTASRVNVYLSTNVVTIENRRGVSVEIRTFAIRTRNSY